VVAYGLQYTYYIPSQRVWGSAWNIVSIIFYGSFAGQGVLLYVRFAVKHGQ
jgi:hypothetical protein